MTERALELARTAEHQIGELIDFVTKLDRAELHRPCPGRQKLGDGTIGAAVRHTADNYQRIAAFVRTGEGSPAAHQPAPQGDRHAGESVDLDVVVEQLRASRDALGRIAELTDRQLVQVPPKDSFRFSDGQRTFDQVLAGVLRHQAHQVEAITTAR